MNFIRAGFRAVRQAPALALAEIAWRWTFGLAAWVAFAIMVRTIMAGVDVSAVETTLAHTSDAFLIADAIARVLVQVLPRFIHALAIAVPVMALVWIATATLGRALTLRSLSGHSTGVSPVTQNNATGGPAYVALALINALRAFFFVATFVAFFGTVFVVSEHTAPDVQSGAFPLLVFAWLLLAVFVGVLWGVVNWFLALAPIFCRGGAWRAIADSLAFYRARSRDYLAIASAFGLFRLAALVVAILAGFVIVAAGTVTVAVVLTVILALAYFAAADFLYIARLAAYVALANSPVPEAAVSAAVTSTVLPPATPYTETGTET